MNPFHYDLLFTLVINKHPVENYFEYIYMNNFFLLQQNFVLVAQVIAHWDLENIPLLFSLTVDF